MLTKPDTDLQLRIRLDKKTKTNMAESEKIYRVANCGIRGRGAICAWRSLTVLNVVLGHITSRNRDGWSSTIRDFQAVP